MNKPLTKCKCGKEFDEYGNKFVINPMTQEFSCYDCWVADKEKKEAEVDVCCRCWKELNGKDFIDHRYCLAPDKKGKTGWNLFCISCEPYPKESGKH